MVNFKRTMAACGVAVIAMVGLAAVVNGWEDPKRTNYITVSTPFALPGVALPAGTYIFELAAPDSDLNLVRVMSRDRLHVYLTAFTHEVRRPANMRNDKALSFGEFKSGMTPPVTAWYPVGDLRGHQFDYGKKSPQLATR
jgi:hypothetical protein